MNNNHTKFQNSFPKECYCFHYIRFFLVTGFVLPHYNQLKILINYFSRLKQYLEMYNSSGVLKKFMVLILYYYMRILEDKLVQESVSSNGRILCC